MVAMVAHSINEPNQRAQAIGDARLIAAAPALLEALRNLLSFSVVLSDEYLSAFENWPADREIQGWPKERWLRASAAKKEAIAAIAAATGGAQ